MDKWFIKKPESPVPAKIHLTEKEKLWMASNPTIRVRITDYPPYIIPDKNGNHSGIAIDHLTLIAERTGIRFNYYQSGKPFREALASLKKHKGPDVISTIVATPERQKHVLFSSPYLTSPYVIFMRTDNNNIISGIEDILDKKIAIQKGSALHSIFKVSFPDINLMLYNYDIQGLEAVSAKKADAYIGNLTMASYQILNKGLFNIKVAAPSPFGEQIYSIGSRNDWPELAGIIEKGLATITPAEQAAINNRYISVKYDRLEKSLIFKWGLIFLLIVSGIFLLFLLVNRSLKKQVDERTGELKTSEEKYRYLFENMLQGVFYQSSSGELSDVNSAALEMFGLSYDQFIGTTSKDPQWKVIHEDGADFPGEEHPSMVALSTGKEIRNVVAGIYNVRKKGYTWVMINAVPQFKNGDKKPYQVFVTMHDITERKKFEEERNVLAARLNQAQKIETIGTLAGGIAHDFNNILFPIIGHTELLIEDIPEGSILEDSVKEIYTAALRASELVKQILTFARQDSNTSKLIKIQPIMNEALKLTRATVPTTIDIKQTIDNNCGIIKADPTQIHQIIMNLMTNAYHAMQDSGGELIVGLKEVILNENEVSCLDIEPGSYACITVTDTGSGMDKSILAKIFDPFFTTKQQGKGTGMGLSVVHGIVKNSGGAIRVDSKIGTGTEFKVYLPVFKSSFEKHELQTSESFRGGTEHILLVDDEEAILKMEKQLLERLGYQVSYSNSSLNALEIFHEAPEQFDLVITDMAMPNMAGDKLSAELKKIRPDIPILLCTGFSERHPEQLAESIGVKGFLMKPIVKADFSKKIREILDG